MRKKSILSFAIACIIAINALSQTCITQVKQHRNGGWIYMNQKGETVINRVYPKSWRFSDVGLAMVYDAYLNQYYFIDIKGEKLKTEIVGFQPKELFGYNFSSPGFNDGLCLIKYDKWGYFDSSGKLVIRAKYDYASYFNNGFATAKMGTKFFVINKKGDEYLLPSNVSKVSEFAEGLAPFCSVEKLFGFINAEGQIEIPARYKSVGYFSDGLAWAKTNDGLLGYINTKGEWVIKPQFSGGKEFEKVSGIVRVKVNGKWAFINKNGDFKKLYDGEDLDDFSEGFAAGQRNGKFGFYDNIGKWVIEPQCGQVRSFRNGFAAAKKGSQ